MNFLSISLEDSKLTNGADKSKTNRKRIYEGVHVPRLLIFCLSVVAFWSTAAFSERLRPDDLGPGYHPSVYENIAKANGAPLEQSVYYHRSLARYPGYAPHSMYPTGGPGAYYPNLSSAYSYPVPVAAPIFGYPASYANDEYFFQGSPITAPYYSSPAPIVGGTVPGWYPGRLPTIQGGFLPGREPWLAPAPPARPRFRR